MDIFNKFRVSSSVSKTKKLWAEFKKVSLLKDESETLNKLKKFLDHVQESLKLYVEKNENKKQIDSIIGEASEILNDLLQFLQDYDKAFEKANPNNVLANEIVNQILEIVEFILRDEKYRKQFENSLPILNNFLNVAEKLEKSESKVTVVELIIMIAENVDSKVSFVQKEGFSKLMKMLMDKDERVSRVISRALLHFLQIDNSDESRLLNEMQGQIEEKEEFNSIKKKIKKIALDFRKFTFNEIQRIFLQNDAAPAQSNTTTQINGQESNPNNKEKQQSIVKGTSLYQQGSSPAKDTNGNTINANNPTEFGEPPTYEDIFETDLMLLIALKINQQQNINEQVNILSSDHLENSINSNERVLQNYNNNNGQGSSQINIKPPSQPGSMIGEEFEETKNNNSSSINQQGGGQIKSADQTSDQSEEVFTILSGGFKAILKTLSQGNQEVQLNLMQTIYKLLSSEDLKYKLEFRKVHGYEVLADVFNRVRNYTDERNNKFIQNLIALYIDVIVNDKQRMQIMNFDAYEIFIRLISSSQQYEIIALCLDNLKNLFLSNWKNLIIARRLKSTYHLLALTMRLFESEYENSSQSILQPDSNINGQGIVAQDKQGLNALENHNDVSILEHIKYVYQINNPIYYSSEITQKNEPIGQKQREELLHKVNEIYKVYSYVEGTFSTEYEYAFSEIILKSIFKEQNTLFEFLERKQQRKCCQISTFDNTFYPLMECLKNIVDILLSKVTNSNSVKICLNDDESANYLGRFLFFTDLYLSCDHSRQEQKDERMKQLERENTLIKSIICRNQCEETKKLISDKYVNKLAEKEETKMLMRVIKLNKMKIDQNYTEFNYRVIAVLKDILVNNPAKAQQFIQIEGLSVLSYLTFKIIQDPNFMERVCMLFIDICLNINNSKTVLSNPLLKLEDEKIPIIDNKRVLCFNALFCTLINAHLNDSHHLFFEQLGRLLLKSENLRAFKQESFSLIFLLELLGSGRVVSSNNNLYTQILSIFERIIQKPNQNEIKLVLDSLLNSQNLKNLGTKKQDIAFFTDALSIMAIHILLNTTPLLNTRPSVLEKISPLLERIINDKYILNLFGCFDSHNPEVKEMVLKFILLCMSIYSKTKKNEVYGKKEHFYYLLSQKIQSGNVSQNICKILYDFTFWEYNPNILYPSNSSVVSTLLNRSEQAGNIMNLAKSQIEQMKIGKIITNIDMLELFFKALKEYEAEDQTDENHTTFRNEMLNVFEAVLDEPNNLNLILDQPHFLNWFYLLLPNNWKNLSDPHLNNNNEKSNHFDNGLSKSIHTLHNNSMKSNNNMLNSQKMANNSDKKQDNSVLGNDYNINQMKSGSNEEILKIGPHNFNSNSSNNNNNNNINDSKKISRDSSLRESSFSHGMQQSQYKQISHQQHMAYKMEKEKVFQIIHKIMTHFFHKKRGDFSEFIKRFIHQDDDFLIVVIKYFFNGLLSNQQNCILKDDTASNFLKNFKEFIDNVDQLFGYEAEINILIHQCITKMMYKNSPKIRTSMKNLNLFDKRDSLLIRILSYELDGNIFVKVFEGISFEALSNLKEFHDKHALSSIVKIFIENSNNFSLQMLIMKILKNPTLSEKNQKYVVELLDSPKLIQFFYPQFQRRKQSSIAKCLQSNLNNSNTKNNNSNNDENDQESDSNDEDNEQEEGKRNKSNSKQSIQHGASFKDDFFKDFYSLENSDIRKQIMLRINKNLMPILHEKEEKEKQMKENKEQHRQKYSNIQDKDIKKAKLKVSALEIEINKKLIESSEDYNKKQKEFNDYTNKKLSEGESIYEKYSSNVVEFNNNQQLSKKI